jgi:hypothetical protein
MIQAQIQEGKNEITGMFGPGGYRLSCNFRQKKTKQMLNRKLR